MENGVRRLIRKPEKHMGKIENVSPNQCSHTKPLGVKVKKDTTLKIEKVNVRELR